MKTKYRNYVHINLGFKLANTYACQAARISSLDENVKLLQTVAKCQL